MNIEKAKTEVVKDTSVSKDKYIPVKKFETGKWYVCHLNERPSTWSSYGGMDGLLDGKPHKCTFGEGVSAEFEDIPSNGFGGWLFSSQLGYFEEVPSPVKSYSERQAEQMKVYLVMDAYDRQCNGEYSTRKLAEARIDELDAREVSEIEEHYLHTEDEND